MASVALVIEKQLQSWMALWRAGNPQFNLTAFEKLHEKVIVPEQEHPYDPSQENPSRKLVYVFSPNRMRFIDPYLGMELWEQDGKIVAGFEPDSGVALVDLNEKTWKRLLFCGTPCGFQDVTWIDNDTFAVVGSSVYDQAGQLAHCTETDEDSSRGFCTIPMLYIFDLARNVRSTYTAPATRTLGGRGYLRAKFPSVKFD